MTPPRVAAGCAMIAPAMEAAAPPARIHPPPPPSAARQGRARRAAAAITTRQAIRMPVPNRPRTKMTAQSAAATRAIRSAVSDVKLDFADLAVGGRDVERQRSILDRGVRDPEEHHGPLDRPVGRRRLELRELISPLERALGLEREQAVARDGLVRRADGVLDREVARDLRRRVALVFD